MDYCFIILDAFRELVLLGVMLFGNSSDCGDGFCLLGGLALPAAQATAACWCCSLAVGVPAAPAAMYWSLAAMDTQQK